MNKAFGLAAVAAVAVLGSVSSSSATVVFPTDGNLGTYTTSGSQGFVGSVAAGATFSDVFTFTLDTYATLSASVTNSYLNLSPISGFTLSVGSINGVTAPDASASSQTASFPPGGQFILFVPGTYELTVSGTGGSAAETYGGSFIVNATTAPSTVPLPNSVALFGVAIAALGVAGAAQRKSTKASA